MSQAPLDPDFDADDTATVADTDVVAYDAVVARLAAEHPEASIAVIDEIVRSEHEAITGGRPLVLPTTVIDGAEERLTEESRQTPT